MQRKSLYIATIVTGILVAAWGCKQKPAEVKHEHTFTQHGSVREINIWLEEPNFPEHEGRGEFLAYCSMCHSTKYVTMQPNFSRKVWEAEVTKMIVKYKAPIDSVTAKKITDYIVMTKKPDARYP